MEKASVVAQPNNEDNFELITYDSDRAKGAILTQVSNGLRFFGSRHSHVYYLHGIILSESSLPAMGDQTLLILFGRTRFSFKN